MNKLNRLHVSMLAALLGSVALVGCKKKEEPAPPPVASEPAPMAQPPAPMPASASVTSVDLVRDIGYERGGTPRPTPLLFSADSANPYEVSDCAPLIANVTCLEGVKLFETCAVRRFV